MSDADFDEQMARLHESQMAFYIRGMRMQLKELSRNEYPSGNLEFGIKGGVEQSEMLREVIVENIRDLNIYNLSVDEPWYDYEAGLYQVRVSIIPTEV